MGKRMNGLPTTGELTVSLFSVVDHHPAGKRGIGELYRQLMDEIVLAEKLGYDTAWIAEHHFHEYGVTPNPAVYLAAAAQRTTRIRLAPAVSVLPFRNPLQVAEDYAMLDQLSNGRCTLGVGSGYLAHEFKGFALPSESKREHFDEALDIVKRALAGERIAIDSPYHRFDGAVLNLPTVQKEIPIYVAALRMESAYHIGRQGNRLLTVPYASVDRLEEIRDIAVAYYKGFAESGADPANAEIAMALHTHVAESDAAARAAAAEAFDLYVATRVYAKSQVWNDIWNSRLALFGSVERVAGLLGEIYDMGIRNVLLLQNFGGLDPAHVSRSMELAIGEVAPRVGARNPT